MSGLSLWPRTPPCALMSLMMMLYCASASPPPTPWPLAPRAEAAALELSVTVRPMLIVVAETPGPTDAVVVPGAAVPPPEPERLVAPGAVEEGPVPPTPPTAPVTEPPGPDELVPAGGPPRPLVPAPLLGARPDLEAPTVDPHAAARSDKTTNPASLDRRMLTSGGPGTRAAAQQGRRGSTTP